MGAKAFTLKNGSSQGPNLALTGLLAPNSLDRGCVVLVAIRSTDCSPWSDTGGANGSFQFGYEFKCWHQSRPVCPGLQLPMGAEGNRHPIRLPPRYPRKDTADYEGILRITRKWMIHRPFGRPYCRNIGRVFRMRQQTVGFSAPTTALAARCVARHACPG